MLQILHDTKGGYQIETVPILFYPEGSRYRARYKKKNIERSIVAAVENDPTVYNNKPAIVCLRFLKDHDVLPNGFEIELDPILAWRQTDRLIPIRHATIEEIKDDGLLIQVIYKLSGYFSPQGTDANTLIDHSIELNKSIEAAVKKPVAEESLLSIVNHARFRDSEDQTITEAEKWQRLIGLFSLIGGLITVPYPRIASIREIRNGKFQNSSSINIKSGSSAIELRAGLTYCITITDGYPQEFLRPKPYKNDQEQKQRQYKLAFDGCFMTAVSERTALGGYDQCDFIFQVRDAAEGRCGEIQLSRLSLGEQTSRIATEFSIPYEVFTDISSKKFFGLAFLAGLMIERIFAAPTVMAYLFSDWVIKSIPITLALTLLDAGLILLTAYFFVDYLISKRRHQEGLR